MAREYILIPVEEFLKLKQAQEEKEYLVRLMLEIAGDITDLTSSSLRKMRNVIKKHQ